MKKLFQIIILVFLTTSLLGCGGGTDQLVKLKNGELVIWRDLSTTSSFSENDCGKVISNSSALLDLASVNNGRFDMLLFWGRSAPKEKIANFPMAVSPTSGDMTSFEVLESNISGDNLILEVKRDNGSIAVFKFKQGSDGVIRQEKYTLKNPTPEQIREYEKHDKAGVIKPVNYQTCTRASYDAFFRGMEEKGPPPKPSVDSAEDYIKSRTWSNVSCSGPKSMYVTFSPMFGEVTFIEGKTTLSHTNIENEFFDDSPNQFSYKTIMYSDSTRTKVNSVAMGTVTLLTQDKIQIKRTLRLGPPADSTMTETVTYVACPQ